MIAHDIGNWVPDNLDEQQINGVIERAEQDRAAGRIPQHAMQLPPGGRIVNGEVHQPQPQPPPLLPFQPPPLPPHARARAQVQVRPGAALRFEHLARQG